MAALEAVSALLCERYNVPELDGPLAEAIAEGSVDRLRVLLADRELYRWHDPIMAALDASQGAPVEPEPVVEPEPEPEATEEAEEATEEPEEKPAPRRRGKSN
jgi:hypothetical protein